MYDDYNKNTREVKPGDTEGDYYIPRIRWTKSAEQLAIFKLNRNQNRLDMYLANPKSTVATLTLSEEDPYYIDYGLIDDIYFMNDGKSFLYVSERDGYRHVYRYRMNGLLDKQLTSGPWDVTAVYGYDEKTGTLYYQAAEASPMQRDVYALDAKGRTTRLTDGQGTHQATFNSTFTNFIDNGSTTATPNRMALRTNKGKRIARAGGQCCPGKHGAGTGPAPKGVFPIHYFGRRDVERLDGSSCRFRHRSPLSPAVGAVQRSRLAGSAGQLEHRLGNTTWHSRATWWRVSMGAAREHAGRNSANAPTADSARWRCATRLRPPATSACSPASTRSASASGDGATAAS